MKVVHWLFPDFAFTWLVEEAKKNIPLELDFLNEGHNAEKVAKMLAHISFLKVGLDLFLPSFEGVSIHTALPTLRRITVQTHGPELDSCILAVGSSLL